MNKNQFFKPTVLYKEYMILDMIEKNSRVTQREISKEIGIALSMVNDHLDQFEKERLVKRVKHSTKNVEYLITKKGIERKKYLNIGYLNSAQQIYNSAKDNIEHFLKEIVEKGFINILFYGAGEVCEIMLSTVKSSKTFGINVVSVIDDDKSKLGHQVDGVNIIDLNQIRNIKHDGILISSFTNNEIIFKRLKDGGYPEDKIIQFFNI